MLESTLALAAVLVAAVRGNSWQLAESVYKHSSGLPSREAKKCS